MANIGFYGSHNASYVVERDGEILGVYEAERILNFKNSGIAQYLCPKVSDLLFLSKYMPEMIMRQWDIEEFETCYYLNTDVKIWETHHLEKNIKAKNYVHCLHHESHAAGCFYQSPHREAIVFSFDGGGNDGKFNVYHAVRGQSPKRLAQLTNGSPHIYYDLGFPYMVFGEYLQDIRYDALAVGNLTYAGKIMGLSSYGVVNEKWLPHFIEFYKSDPNGGIPFDGKTTFDYEPKIDILGNEIGITFDINNRISGQVGYDIAATSQRAFEECFLEIAKPYFQKYPDLPICVTGGCALNIILNTRLVNEFGKNVFVGPNPNDCGIALGMVLNVLRPKEPYVATYSGQELFDLNMLPLYIQNTHSVGFKSSELCLNQLSRDLMAGRIIGVARDRAEHGPRALGNRSILCNPAISDMKDVLNAKVKNREPHRPYAGVVREKDVSKYFEWSGESPWMNFCPKVRKQYREIIPAVTHVDGTCRVQTVTEEQNPWLYSLLNEFDKLTGIPVLLNTSFNVSGKPILSSIKDAIEIFESTEMDGLVIENTYLRKNEE